MNRVLIVAGDQDSGVRFQGALSQSGYQTALVWSGDQMTDFCRQHTPDLALVDLDIPGESLWGNLQAVKTMGNLANLPLLGISAVGDPQTMEQAQSYGFSAVYPKNDDPATVVNAVRKMTESNQNHETSGVTSPEVPSTGRDESLNRLVALTAEVVHVTKDLKHHLNEFGNDGPELFSYIENSGEAIRAKLAALPPDSLHDKELRHDFRNMIGSVTGFAELIMMEPSVSPNSSRGLGRLRECSKTFVDILDEQKVESGV